MIGSATLDGMEMPSYNVRHSIATKVAAKKTAKGYTLSDENCTLCEMPLMTMNGNSECKVCPAIKKWLQRKIDADTNAHNEEVEDDAREEVEEVMEEENAEVRDEASVGATYNDEVRCEDDIASIGEEEPDEKVVVDDSFEKSEVKATGSDESTEIASKASDDSGEYDESLARRLENMNMYNSNSTDESTFLSRSASEESEDTDAIRQRARQIIMQAKGKGEWGGSDDEDDDEDDNASINSPILSTFSSESIDDAAFAGRAEAIINRARKSVQVEHGEDAPGSYLSPRLSPKESVSFEEPSPQGEEAIGERIERSGSEHFEPHDVYNSEDWCDKSDTVEEQNGNDATEDIAQDDLQETAQEDFVQEDPPETCPDSNEVDLDVEQEDDDPVVTQKEEEVVGQNDVVHDFEDKQDTTDPNLAGKDTSIADGQEPVPFVEEDSSFVVEPPEQQQEVPMSDYADAGMPARGIFAQLACKFDDAVTDAIGRVQKIVTCANTETNGGYENGFEEAFDAEQIQHHMNAVDPHSIAAAASSAGHGQVKYDALSPRHAKYEAQTALLAMQGWQVANVSCRGCSRSMMFRPQDGHMICADCDTVQPQAPPVHPSYVPSQGYPLHPQHPMSVTNHAVSSQLYNIEMNNRLHMGWVALNHGCPYCNSQLMRNPNDSIDQCLACGPIFNQPMQASTPSMSGMASYTPMGDMTSYTPMGGYPAAVHDIPNASFGAPPPPPIAPPASSGQSFDPREEGALTPKEVQAIAPNLNQVLQSSFVQGDEENAPHQANMSQQLDDTKSRIEDAKKFIMSRNSRRSNPNLPPLANNRAPAMQAAPFKQQMSMLTPGSRTAAPFSRQSSVTTPVSGAMVAPSPLGERTMSQNGSVQPDAYHNHLTGMGSLMSPESITNDHHPNKVKDDTAQVDKMRLLSPENEENAEVVSAASNGTKNSGYRTPQMPGKYFFA